MSAFQRFLLALVNSISFMHEKPPVTPPQSAEESPDEESKRLELEMDALKKKIVEIEDRWKLATDTTGKKALEREWGRLKNELAGRILRRDSL
jgi:hypothetical protein